MASCKMYTEEFISRFVDLEVSKTDHDAFIRHMAVCAACTETEKAFRQVSADADTFIESNALKISHGLPPISAEDIHTRASRPRGGFLKLASLGTAAIIFAAALLPWTGEIMDEPSAIVNSVDTTGSSVIIIDNPDTRHTIIWFSET